MLQSYRPSNRVPWHGFVFLLLTAIVGGLALGGFAATLSRLVWLIVLFPLGLGLLAGVLLSKVVLRHKVRSPIVSMAAALLMAIMIYAAFHYVDYQTFKFELDQIIVAQQGLRDPAARDQALDGFLAQTTGYRGFFGYLKFTAQEGISIGHFDSSQTYTLNEPLTWLYWVVEFGIIIAMAIAGVLDDAKKPFCEDCNRWYQSGEHLGSVATSNATQFIELVQTGNMRQARMLMGHDNGMSPSLEVYIQRCPREYEHASVLAVRSTAFDAKGNMRFKDILEAMITPHEMAELRPAEALV
jgi:hypothetical protein